MYSCKKEPITVECPDNSTVLINQSGNVKISVIDENDNGVKGAVISLYSSNNILFNDSTDENGIFEVGNLLQSEYRCYVSTNRDNKTYWDNKYFQVISGEEHTIELTP